MRWLLLLSLALVIAACGQTPDKPATKSIALLDVVVPQPVLSKNITLTGTLFPDDTDHRFLKIPLAKLVPHSEIDRSRWTVTCQTQTVAVKGDGTFRFTEIEPAELLHFHANHPGALLPYRAVHQGPFNGPALLHGFTLDSRTTAMALIRERGLIENLALSPREIEKFPAQVAAIRDHFVQFHADSSGTATAILTEVSFQGALTRAVALIRANLYPSPLTTIPGNTNGDLDFSGLWRDPQGHHYFHFQRAPKGGFWGRWLSMQHGGFYNLSPIEAHPERVECTSLARAPLSTHRLTFRWVDGATGFLSATTLFPGEILNLKKIPENYPTTISTQNGPDLFTRWIGHHESGATRTLDLTQNNLAFSGTIEESDPASPFFSARFITNGSIVDGRAEGYVEPAPGVNQRVSLWFHGMDEAIMSLTTLANPSGDESWIAGETTGMVLIRKKIILY